MVTVTRSTPISRSTNIRHMPVDKQLKHLPFPWTNEQRVFIGTALNSSQLNNLCGLVQYWQDTVSAAATKARLDSVEECLTLFLFVISLLKFVLISLFDPDAAFEDSKAIHRLDKNFSKSQYLGNWVFCCLSCCP